VTARHRYIVAGFHRSGTSMVAQALGRCGVDLGPVLIPALASNATGHFEDWDVVELHDAILQDAGSDWLHVGALPTVRPRFVAAMRALAADRDARGPAWGFKDPRVCLFLDTWRSILPDVLVLGVLRHWAPCLDSLRDRGGIAIALAPGDARISLVFWTEPTRALESWLVHTRALLGHAKRHPSRVRLLMQDAATDPAALRAILATVPGLAPPDAAALGVERGLADRATRVPDWIPPALRASLDALWAECVAAVSAPQVKLAQAPAGEAMPVAAIETQTDAAAVPIAALAREADAAIARRDLDRADQLARACIGREPGVGEHHVRLGTCRLHQRRLDEAEIYILRGIALGPTKPHFWAQLASVCQFGGRLDESRQHLARAIEQDPAHPWFRIQSSHLEQRAGRFADSVAAAQEALALDPPNVVAHLRLIDALVRAGQFDEAMAAATAAKARFPDDEEVARRETRALWIVGRAAEARAQEHARMEANLAALAAGDPADDPRSRVTDPVQRADLAARIEKAVRRSGGRLPQGGDAP
jgi:tetratricopeptide (TPR) repeat protein